MKDHRSGAEPNAGNGVEEIRVRDKSGIYHVMDRVRMADAVYVLPAPRTRRRLRPNGT
jgi:phage-related protein